MSLSRTDGFEKEFLHPRHKQKYVAWNMRTVSSNYVGRSELPVLQTVSLRLTARTKRSAGMFASHLVVWTSVGHFGSSVVTRTKSLRRLHRFTAAKMIGSWSPAMRTMSHSCKSSGRKCSTRSATQGETHPTRGKIVCRTQHEVQSQSVHSFSL